MTRARAIRALRALKRDILADGVVDWEETERLMTFLHSELNALGPEFETYLRLLERCRADGRITAEESRLLVLMLELLCERLGRRQVVVWLAVAVVVLALIAVFA